jgi:imidazole glycerol phosphate synthase glutamine amidotransferase subunit
VSRPLVTLLDYGSGNIRSVAKAFEHQGAEVRLAATPAEAESAERLALPGQGHFGQCMTRLREAGLEDAIRAHVRDGRPFLGICVGMQLLYEASEEAPDVPGLGLLPGTVRRLRTDLPLPHVGWNAVEFERAAETDPLLDGVAGPDPRWFYHVHSFAMLESDGEAVLGRCTYDDTFASIVGSANVWGIQFHPEKSQEDGLRILRNFAGM